MAFWGKWEYTVDDRGRVAFPARYRHLFTEGVVLARSPEGCVEIYTPDGFEEAAQLITREPATHERGRDLRRVAYGLSSYAELDRQGRILIPADLRQWADLNGAVVIFGRRECLELWNRQRWERRMEQATTTYGEAMESLE